jgi:hypothetical protein
LLHCTSQQVALRVRYCAASEGQLLGELRKWLARAQSVEDGPNGQNNAACSAVKVKAVLSGKWIERAEIGAPGEYETMTDEELERALKERMARLGLVIEIDQTEH